MDRSVDLDVALIASDLYRMLGPGGADRIEALWRTRTPEQREMFLRSFDRLDLFIRRYPVLQELPSPAIFLDGDYIQLDWEHPDGKLHAIMTFHCECVMVFISGVADDYFMALLYECPLVVSLILKVFNHKAST